MILHYGDLERLKSQIWYMIELSSDKTAQSIMKRVGKKLPAIFGSEAVELFLPVQTRDLDQFEMRTGNYAFVRSTSFPSLLRLKTVTGVVGLVTEGDSHHPNKAIPLEDSYVQQIIKDTEADFNARVVGIEVGSFVRLIDGETRDYCGLVMAIDSGSAVVGVDLKTKQLLIETPLRNLINLVDVPLNQRTFYYSPLIAELVQDLGEEGLQLIAEDITFKPEEDTREPVPAPKPIIEENMQHSRQRTITALTKRLVFEGVYDPLDIGRALIANVKSRTIKAPKNLFIAYCVIKNSLMKYHFTKIDPEIKNYRDVINKYGKQYKFSAQKLAELDPSLKIPISTLEVCKDGRSREARLKKRQTQEN
jgi:transcription antitermination factor NusG